MVWVILSYYNYMSYYVTRKFLESIFGSSAGSYSLPIVGMSKRITRQTLSVSGLSSRDISRTLWRLRKSRIIEFHEDGENVKIVLTESGKKRILHYKLGNMEIKKPKRWDGNWRIVAFDIPENKKVARNALGYKMKEIGLLPFQKSLWIYPYECKDEIDFISSVFEVGKYVHYIVTRSITNDELLRKRFNLS
jgi:DNA-binding transcriptional regulator PaaX